MPDFMLIRAGTNQLLKYILEMEVRLDWHFCWDLSNAISGGNWLFKWDFAFSGGTLYPSANYETCPQNTENAGNELVSFDKKLGKLTLI